MRVGQWSPRTVFDARIGFQRMDFLLPYGDSRSISA